MCAFNGSLHWRFAFLVWVLIQCQIDVWLNPLPVLFATLLPDADIKSSLIGKIIPLWLIWKHRTFTHTIWAMILFSLPFFSYDFKWGLLFCGGYFIHLIMDSGTPMSVKWMGKNPKFYTLVTCLVLGCMLIW